MSMVYAYYLIFLFCFTTAYCAVKYMLSAKLIRKEREYITKTLSHDIRVAVIAQIRGLDLLHKNTSEQAELINELDKNCKYTLDMVSMLINTYKYKNNELLLKYEPINLSRIIFSAAENFAQQANEKGIIFNYYNDSVIIPADKVWITKAIEIIISTIVELSNKNQRITCSLKNLGSNIRLAFRYTGRSLTNEEYKKMFSGNSNYSTVGFGIKMHLLKNIVEIHAGKITVKKTETGENTFTIILPVKKSVTSNISRDRKSFQLFQL